MRKHKPVPRASPRHGPLLQLPAWLLPCLALALLAFGVYANALSNGFVSDDNFQLLNNPLVTDFHRIPTIFRSNVWAFAGAETTNYYRPLQLLLYMALYYVAGFDAFSFHLLMLLLHVGNTLLVYGLGRRLLASPASSRPAPSAAPAPTAPLAPTAALAAGALFAVHPIHTEAVVWVAVLPDVLMAVLVLVAVWLFARQDGTPRDFQVAGHCALYLLALLTKETGVMLLPLLVGYEWLYLGRRLRDLRKNAVFYAALLSTLGFYLTLRYAALGGLAPAQNFHFRLNRAEYFLSVVVTAGQYLGKLVLPTGLSYYHMFEATRRVTTAFLVSLPALTALLAAIPLLRRRNHPGQRLLPQLQPRPVVSYGAFWVVVTLVPVLNLTGVGENVFAERYLYLPSVGFVWVAGVGWDWLAGRQRKWAWGAAAVVLVACSVMVAVRNRDWHDDIRLFTVSARQSPRSGTLRGNLGWFHFQLGNYNAAIAEYRAALELQPDSALFRNNLGNALAMSGRPREAIQEIRTALRLKPLYPEAHLNLGLALEAAGDVKAAAAEYGRAWAMKPNYAEAMTALGLVRFKSGDLAAAIDLYRQATAAKPDYPEAYINLGVAYNNSAKYSEAAQALQKAIEVGSRYPNIYVAHYNLGVAYANLNSPEAAAAEFRQAYQLRPDFQAAKEAYEKIQVLLQQRRGTTLPFPR